MLTWILIAKVLLITVCESAFFLGLLVMFLRYERHKTPIDKNLRLWQGLAFIVFAMFLVAVALGLQALTGGWFNSADEAAPALTTLAALLYVIPAVAAAIGANILTEYVKAGP